VRWDVGDWANDCVFAARSCFGLARIWRTNILTIWLYEKIELEGGGFGGVVMRYGWLRGGWKWDEAVHEEPYSDMGVF
jgi:hypothetical protein